MLSGNSRRLSLLYTPEEFGRGQGAIGKAQKTRNKIKEIHASVCHSPAPSGPAVTQREIIHLFITCWLIILLMSGGLFITRYSPKIKFNDKQKQISKVKQNK